VVHWKLVNHDTGGLKHLNLASHRLMFDRTHKKAAFRSLRKDAVDRQVIRLGATAGEEHPLGCSPDQMSNVLPGLGEETPRRFTRFMRARRIGGAKAQRSQNCLPHFG
jgi:hypothetical protein